MTGKNTSVKRKLTTDDKISLGIISFFLTIGLLFSGLGLYALLKDGNKTILVFGGAIAGAAALYGVNFLIAFFSREEEGVSGEPWFKRYDKSKLIASGISVTIGILFFVPGLMTKLKTGNSIAFPVSLAFLGIGAVLGLAVLIDFLLREKG